MKIRGKMYQTVYQQAHLKFENMALIVDSMATANLNKSEDLVTNNTAASKYVPRRSRI